MHGGVGNRWPDLDRCWDVPAVDVRACVPQGVPQWVLWELDQWLQATAMSWNRVQEAMLWQRYWSDTFEENVCQVPRKVVEYGYRQRGRYILVSITRLPIRFCVRRGWFRIQVSFLQQALLLRLSSQFPYWINLRRVQSFQHAFKKRWPILEIRVGQKDETMQAM